MVFSIRSTAVLSLFIAALAFLPSEAFGACRVEDSAFLQSFRNNANEDLNDYARILADVYLAMTGGQSALLLDEGPRGALEEAVVSAAQSRGDTSQNR